MEESAKPIELDLTDKRLFRVTVIGTTVESQELWVAADNGKQVNEWAKKQGVINDCTIQETTYKPDELKAEGKKIDFVLPEKSEEDEKESKKKDLAKSMECSGYHKFIKLDYNIPGKGVASLENGWVKFEYNNLAHIRFLNQDNTDLIREIGIYNDFFFLDKEIVEEEDKCASCGSKKGKK